MTDSDWERTKCALVRSLFHDYPSQPEPVRSSLSSLSTLFDEESEDTSITPQKESSDEAEAEDSLLEDRPESPLPPLIIEREPYINKHDDSEEFYIELEKRVMKYYKHLFNPQNYSNDSEEDDNSQPTLERSHRISQPTLERTGKEDSSGTREEQSSIFNKAIVFKDVENETFIDREATLEDSPHRNTEQRYSQSSSSLSEELLFVRTVAQVHREPEETDQECDIAEERESEEHESHDSERAAKRSSSENSSFELNGARKFLSPILETTEVYKEVDIQDVEVSTVTSEIYTLACKASEPGKPTLVENLTEEHESSELRDHIEEMRTPTHHPERDSIRTLSLPSVRKRRRERYNSFSSSDSDIPKTPSRKLSFLTSTPTHIHRDSKKRKTSSDDNQSTSSSFRQVKKKRKRCSKAKLKSVSAIKKQWAMISKNFFAREPMVFRLCQRSDHSTDTSESN